MGLLVLHGISNIYIYPNWYNLFNLIALEMVNQHKRKGYRLFFIFTYNSLNYMEWGFSHTHNQNAIGIQT